jgi:hypothetical protein
MPTQLDLFSPPAHHNPFAAVQGVNLFGQRGLFTGFCCCTGGDLVRLAYAGEAA